MTKNSPIPSIVQGNGHTCLKAAAVPALLTMAVAQLPGLTLVLKINKGEGALIFFNKYNFDSRRKKKIISNGNHQKDTSRLR